MTFCRVPLEMGGFFHKGQEIGPVNCPQKIQESQQKIATEQNRQKKGWTSLLGAFWIKNKKDDYGAKSISTRDFEKN